MRTASLAVLALLGATLPAQRPSRSEQPASLPPRTPLDPAVGELLNWRLLGPAAMGGRIIDIEVSPKDSSTFWVATASAGLLKTTNNGVTFEHQFDHESVASVGALAVAPSDPDVLWVGTGENNPRNSVSYGDGVHKSVDGGKTWKHMGLDQAFQIGDIVIDPRDANVVFVGVLGRLYGPSEQRGLYVTRDGGEHWERTLFVDDRTGVIDIATDPADPDTLLAASYERERDIYDSNDPAKKWGAGSAIWRSADGGRTFEKVSEGLPTVTLGRVGFDWNAKDGKVVFALVESEMTGKAADDVGWSGVETGDAEAGAKVNSVARGSPGEKAGLKSGDIVLAVAGKAVASDRVFREAMAQFAPDSEVELEVVRGGESVHPKVALGKRPAPRNRRGNEGGADSESGDEAGGAPRGGRPGNDPNASERPFGDYLGSQTANVQRLQGKDGHQYGGLYRSDDAGRTWHRINSIDPRPMYFSQVRVDPSDDKLLWVLGVSLSRSKDGGETFTSDGGPNVHADQHAMWIDPRDGRHMLVGCDGGLYQTWDRGANWDHLNRAALGQFYDVALDTRRDYWVYGGLQDNGTWGAPARAERGNGTINEDWVRVGSGDGFVVAVDPNDPMQVYYESQNGGTGRTNLSTMDGGGIRPRAERGVNYRFNWKTPFILSAHNSRIYYSAGNKVFRSLDRGNDLAPISPEITRTDKGSATAIAESPRDANALYVGTDDGALWGTRDGGHSWDDLWTLTEGTDVSTAEASASRGENDATPLRGLVPAPRCVSAIEASHFADGRCYITLDAHRSNDDEPYVLVTEDFGRSWQSLRANLPTGSTRFIREDIKNENLLYLGTEFGFWISIDRGQSWTRIQGRLPTVAVHDVAQHPTCGDVVLATHGRSLWTFDATPIRQMSAEVLTQHAKLFDPNDVVVWRSRHRRSSNGPRDFAADNPTSEAEFFYHLDGDASTVTLKVLGLDGKEIRTLEADGKAGLHKVVWDLRPTPPPQPAAGARGPGRGGFGGGRRGGFRGRGVELGTYRVVLEVDGVAQEQRFDLQADPVLGDGPQGRFFGEEDGEDGGEEDEGGGDR